MIGRLIFFPALAGVLGFATHAASVESGPAGEADDASVTEERAQELDESKVETLRWLIKLYQATGRQQEADGCLLLIYAIRDPNTEHAWKLVSKLYLQKRYDLVARFYELSLAYHPELRKSHLDNLASCLLSAGCAERGMRALDEYDRTYAKYEDGWRAVAHILGKHGHAAEAIAYLVEKNGEQPFKNPFTYAELCRLYGKVDEPRKAAEAFDRALALVGAMPKRPAHGEWFGYRRLTELLVNTLVEVCQETDSMELLAELAVAYLRTDPPQSLLWSGSVKRALTKARNERIVEILTPLVHHPDEKLACSVLRAMAEPPDEACALPMFLEALTDARAEVVRVALTPASRFLKDEKHGAQVAQALRAAFDRELGAVKTRAAAFLVRAEDEDAYNHLVGLLTGTDEESARTAVWALTVSHCKGGQPTRPELVEKLLPYMRSADRDTRRRVIDGLARCPDEAVVRGLVGALHDEEKDIAQRAHKLLYWHPDKVLVARLLREALDSTADETERGRIGRTLESVERALRLQGNAQ